MISRWLRSRHEYRSKHGRGAFVIVPTPWWLLNDGLWDR